LRSFEQDLSEFDRRHITVVAISTELPETIRRRCKQQGYTFEFLSDPKGEAIRGYNLLQAGAAAHGAEIARPAEILVDATGTIRWVSPAHSLIVRTRPGDVLKVIDELISSGGVRPRRS
jgi:peroxiredoxin